MAIFFRDEPTGGLPRLWEALRTIVYQLGPRAEGSFIPDVDLVSGLNRVRHGRRSAPQGAGFIPHSNVAWWVPQKPDETFVYIQVAGAVTGDVEVIP